MPSTKSAPDLISFIVYFPSSSTISKMPPLRGTPLFTVLSKAWAWRCLTISCNSFQSASVSIRPCCWYTPEYFFLSFSPFSNGRRFIDEICAFIYFSFSLVFFLTYRSFPWLMGNKHRFEPHGKKIAQFVNNSLFT